MDTIDPNRRAQDRDNWVWIRDAKKNKLVVGTQARILYQDAEGRRDIALAFNKLVRDGKCGPIMAKGGTTAMCLPATSFYLGANFAPARRMIELGIPVATASDFNPGSWRQKKAV